MESSPNTHLLNNKSIMWRRLDCPGHDSCRFRVQSDGYEVIGTALFLSGREPCLLDYRVHTDRAWRTTDAEIVGWHGEEEVSLTLNVNTEHRWEFNGKVIAQVQGCQDVDFAFSPSTNTLVINRLGLSVSECANVSSAWLTFPEMSIIRLDQVYKRSELGRYSYAAPSLKFSTELEVTEFGIVTHYPGLWKQETPNQAL